MRKFSLSLLISLLAVCMCFTAGCAQTPNPNADDLPPLSAGTETTTLGTAQDFVLEYNIGSDIYGGQIIFDLPATIKVKSFKIYSGTEELQPGTANRYLYIKQTNPNLILFFVKRADTSLDDTTKVNNLKFSVTFTASEETLAGVSTIKTSQISKVTSVGTGSLVDIVTTPIDNVTNTVTLTVAQ